MPRRLTRELPSLHGEFRRSSSPRILGFSHTDGKQVNSQSHGKGRELELSAQRPQFTIFPGYSGERQAIICGWLIFTDPTLLWLQGLCSWNCLWGGSMGQGFSAGFRLEPKAGRGLGCWVGLPCLSRGSSCFSLGPAALSD